jgi:LPXTG-motif cell wall-anchored protein
VVEVLDDVIENDDEDEDVTVTEESDEDDDLAATGFGIGAPVILTGSLLILAGAGLVIARRRTA